MKRCLFLIAVLLSAASQISAQQQLKDESVIHFFGADYSLVKVFALTESSRQLSDAFVDVHTLFMTEPYKYNIEKQFDKRTVHRDFDQAIKNNGSLATVDMKTTDRTYRVEEGDILGLIRQYDAGDQTGTGLLFVGELLDKDKGMGYYKVVFFDLQSKDIIYMREASGKCGGFGLRNFWARPIYNIIDRWKWVK